MSRTPKQILIVDDDGDIRETLSQILEEEGYGVLMASNGAEALARLREAPCPDLILLDLMMPVMDGWQFRTEQRRDPALAEIPVIILSAAGNLHDNTRGFGAAATIKKPIYLDDLLEAIERHSR